MSEPSNIIRRKKVDPLNVDIDMVDEIIYAGQEGRRPNIFPNMNGEDEEEVTSTEQIWVDYGIKPGLPAKAKIEQLLVVYRLEPEDIARVMDIKVETVEDIIRTLNSEWSCLGRVMSPDERDIARGRMISELVRMKSEIEKAMTGASPSDKARLLSLKMSVVNQLTTLQGLSIDKREPLKSDDATDPLDAAVKNMTDERRDALYARLKWKDSNLPSAP